MSVAKQIIEARAVCTPRIRQDLVEVRRSRPHSPSRAAVDDVLRQFAREYPWAISFWLDELEGQQPKPAPKPHVRADSSFTSSPMWKRIREHNTWARMGLYLPMSKKR